MQQLQVLLAIVLAVTNVEGAGLCAGTIIVHPISAQPLLCQVHEDCRSITCELNTTTRALQSPMLQGRVSFQVDPCDTAASSFQLSLNSSVPSRNWSVSSNVSITQLGRVEISDQSAVGGYLHVLDLVLGRSHNNGNVLYYIASEMQEPGSDDHYPLFNATINFNVTNLCRATSITTTTHQPPPPVTSEPLRTYHTTCEAILAIGSLSNYCAVGRPSLCKSLDCSVLGEYRITLTVLPCNTLPGVSVLINHMMEGVILEDVFTSSHIQALYVGESKLLDYSVIVEQHSEENHIKFQLELMFPWEENIVVVPQTLIPVGQSQCRTETTTSASPQHSSLSHTELILVVVMSVLLALTVVLVAAMISCAARTRCQEGKPNEQSQFQKTNKIILYKPTEKSGDTVNLL